MKQVVCFISVFFILSISFPVLGQKWLWAKNGSGNTINEGYSVCTDINGSVFITGTFAGSTSFGSFTLTTNPYNPEVFVAKYDSIGNVLWAKQANGGQTDFSNSIATDAAGNVYITGYFWSTSISFGTFTLMNYGPSPNYSPDIFVVKYDPNGNVLWAKSAGGNSSDFGNGICTDATGNVYVTGYFQSSSITFGSFTIGPGWENMYLVKYDSNGNVLWAKCAGASHYGQNVVSNALSVDANNNIFITGYFSCDTFKFGANKLINKQWPRNDVLLAKYDANGNELWATSAGSINDDNGNSVSADPNGNVFLTGDFLNPSIAFGSTVIASNGNRDMFYAKYDPNGNLLWAKGAGGTVGDIGYSVCADAKGNAFIAGGFNSSTISFGSTILYQPVNCPSPPIDCDPMFIIKIDANGNTLCGDVLASGGDDKNCVNVDRFGNAYVTGDFLSTPFVVGTYSLALTGTEDIFVAKYFCCDSKVLPSITGADTICSGSSATLIASGGASYLWNVGLSTQAISVTPIITTTYSVTTNDYHGCQGDTNFTVTVLQSPTVITSGNVLIFPGQSTTLTANGGANYLWNNGETTTAISVAPSITTMYCVTIADTNNCKDSICATVFVESPCDTAGTFFFPNAFSPNNDGDNDALKIYYNEMSCIASLHLIIYDRWGELIYETSDKNFSWDGTYPGKPLNTQVLAYHLTVGFTDGKAINRKGNVSLVR